MIFFQEQKKNFFEMTNPDSNPINFLQEICQKNFLAFPIYTELESSGQSHCPTFSFSCSFEGSRSTGLGHDKKTAKKKAGAKMVELLKEQGFFDKYNKRDDSLTKIDQLNKDVNESTDKNGTMKTRKNPISALNEYCSKKKIEQPVFVETSAGINNFIVACTFLDKKTYGSGSSKKSAKTESAAKMCEELNIPSANEPIFVAGKLYKPNLYNSYEEEPSFVEDQNCVHVHKLQEYVVKNNLKEPIYQEKNLINNLFEITCNVGYVSGKGTDLTVEEAKNVAACEVLSKLTKSFPQIENG